MVGKFSIERAKGGEYFFEVFYGDGCRLASSDCFETLAACRSGIKAVCVNLDAPIADEDGEGFCVGKSVYEISHDGDDYSFLLKGVFGEVLVSGSDFETRGDCLEAVRRMKQLKDAQIDCAETGPRF